MRETDAARPRLLMRSGVPPETAPGRLARSGPKHAIRRENGLLIESDVAVPLRDGTRILVDVYRPDGGAGLPVLLGWSPYGKHNQTNRLWPQAGVDPAWISPATAFEAPDPADWCRHGYAVAYADPRGTWYSEGEHRHNGQGEGEDCYDLIEWLGTRAWSNGRIGLSGVSYLACIQWLVAPLKPPHLAAINPWEGFSDWYREFGYHGGIPETGFVPRASARLRFSPTRVEDTGANVRAHPLYDEYWASKEFDLEGIEVPAYVVASWSDQGLHTRGTLEAFERISSRHKWLEVHGQKKWAYYYQPSSVARQRAFFDHFLRGADDTVRSWPKVRLEVRERAGAGVWRDEEDWPLARTEHRRLYLDAADGTLRPDQPATAAAARYAADDPTQQAEFEHVFAEDTELTGRMKLRLWVEAEGADDMDLFVAVQKLDHAGTRVPFVFYALYEDGPVALGWLRASHRELDPARSRDERPWHPHTRQHKLAPGVPVPVDIEIWPSSTRFRRGERLRVVVKGSDVHTDGLEGLPFCRHEDTVNQGWHVIRTGGEYDSHLLVPVVPENEGSTA